MVRSMTWFLQCFSEYHMKFMASFLLLFFIWSVVSRWMSRRTKAPPNWPVVGMLPGVIANVHHLQDYATRFLKESERTFAFKGPWFAGMDFWVTCDPANARHILSLNFSNYNKGSRFEETFDFYGNGIVVAESESWKFQRKMALALMTSSGFRTMVSETGKEKTEKKLLPFLSRMEREGRVFDMQDVLARFSFDVVGVVVFGEDPCCLSLDFPRIPFPDAVDQVHEVAIYRHVVPAFWWKTMRCLGIGEEKKMALALEVIGRYIAGIISSRREENGSLDSSNARRCDVLTSYLSNDSLDDKFLRDTLYTFLTAGRDTTANALLWFFWYVANHPNVEAKLVREIRESKPITSGHGAASLIYLHAALCETLRLSPSVPLNHRAAVQADVLPSGHKVRAGDTVIISAYAMGRMAEIWGEDCMEFKPERWIAEDGKLTHEPSYKFIAFNSGPRTCLGKDMSFTLTKLVAAAVLENFALLPVHGQRVEPKSSMMLGMKNGLMVKLRRRTAILE